MIGRRLWRRWVVANGLAEFVGLTASLALAAGAFSANDRLPLASALAAAAGVAALGALVEGLAVGGAQWWVLREELPRLGPLPWAGATAAGAFVAWLLGMLPSTLLSRGAENAAAAPFDPAIWLQLVMAVGMGIALGPFLGVPQWLVLRRHVRRAGWWILANVTAWAAGMPMVFLATSLIGEGDPPWVIGSYVAAGCLLAGLVVGAVHGAWLVWLLDAREDQR